MKIYTSKDEEYHQFSDEELGRIIRFGRMKNGNIYWAVTLPDKNKSDIIFTDEYYKIIFELKNIVEKMIEEDEFQPKKTGT